MDSNNWRPAQNEAPPPMDGGDWRSQLLPESRQRIVNKIMETLKRHLPFSGQEGLQELRQIAIRFEEKIYSAATSQSDYLRKISLKMLTMESKSQNSLPNALPSNSSGMSRNPQDSVPSQNMQFQVQNQSQSVPHQMASNQSQARQQILAQNMQNNIGSTGMQTTANLPNSLPSVNGLAQNMPNVPQNTSVQSISGISQNSMGNTMNQAVSSTMFTNAQRQLQGRQQQQQQTQLSQQSMMTSQGQQQQQLMGQQPNAANMQQNQLIGQQSNISDMQQQQQQRLLGQQNNLQNMPSHQNMQQQHMMSQQSNLSNMHQQQLGHQSHAGGLSQQQLMGTQSGNANMQSNQHSAHIMQQPKAAAPQQNQNAPLLPSGSLDSTAQTDSTSVGDWQEEVYQKIKAMKDMYFADLNEMHQKIAMKLQQHESLPQQPKMDQVEKLRIFKNMLERLMQVLQVAKNSILPTHREKLPSFEKQIVGLLSTNRPRRPIQPGQILPPQMQNLQPSQQPHSQISQAQSHGVGVNPQMQSMNLQGSAATMQQNNVPSLQHGSVPSLSGVTSSLHSMASSLQANPNIDSGQGSAPSSMQQVAIVSLQQNPVSAPQQANVNSLQSQNGVAHQMPLLHQNDVNDKMRQGLRSGAFPQHLSSAQRFAHQQLKPGASFSVTSPQLFQAVSPQINQNSPQIDQQNLQSISKGGTPLQSANSPYVPSPSTPLAPSPMPGDAEKPAVSSLSNAANIGNQQSGAPAATQSLSIGTPGISPSPLFECAGPDGAHGNNSAVVSGKSSLTEQPLDRLLKAVKSISPKALNASVCDIGSVVSMIDRIAGSAPGNGSRATVGEDLVAMTKCRLQARNFQTQEGSTGTKRMRRYTSAMPLNVTATIGSMNDNFKQFTGSETSDLESTATSNVKKARLEVNHALLEEIREINDRLIDTIVDVSDEDMDPSVAASASEGSEGTIVRCSFSAVSLSPDLKSHYTSAQMSPIQPLRLLVPVNYPNCSPILLDKLPVDVSNEYEDLSVKAKSRFSISLRSLSQPMSLKAIARTWDDCARAVICEYAQQNGGGTFSSKYGTWENCLSAA
uniref:Mediator complex subunit 15 KIX domain-containing protein n=1 Tax=Chenopodium quinoa TaxID=63459 RepID=A0A803MMR0_CHEQI